MHDRVESPTMAGAIAQAALADTGELRVDASQLADRRVVRRWRPEGSSSGA
jgi:hypothetical protein